MPISGCTDSTATNYNPDADFDDGSCTYPDAGDYSLSFDGVDDYVEIPNSTELSGMSQLTVQVWIKKTTNSTNGHIITGAGSSNETFSIYEVSDADLISFFVYTDGAVGGITFDSNSLIMNQWHHISGVYDNNS